MHVDNSLEALSGEDALLLSSLHFYVSLFSFHPLNEK